LKIGHRRKSFDDLKLGAHLIEPSGTLACIGANQKGVNGRGVARRTASLKHMKFSVAPLFGVRFDIRHYPCALDCFAGSYLPDNANEEQYCEQSYDRRRAGIYVVDPIVSRHGPPLFGQYTRWRTKYEYGSLCLVVNNVESIEKSW